MAASTAKSLKTETMAFSSTACISDWSSIPQQLLVLILDRLVSVDYFRVSAVCKYWYRVASDHRKYWSPFNIPPHLPLLTIPFDTPDGQTLSFYGPTDGKLLHSFMLPFDNRLIGSSLGWLIFIDTIGIIKLFNPFSLSPIINLPPAPVDFVSKVILSADPALNPHDYVVAIILHGNLAFLKPGSKKLTWTYNTLSNKFMVDVIYFNNRFHAVSSSGEVYIFDGVLEYPKSKHILIDREIFSLMRQTNTYLLHSCLSGKLLLIQPFVSSFIVYEIKNDDGILTWVPKSDLDDQVFFVGYNNSISVLTSDIPGCKSNSIYFTAVYFPRSADQVVVYARIYNLKDESWEPHFVVKRICTGRMTKEDSKKITPTWFFPVFHKNVD